MKKDYTQYRFLIHKLYKMKSQYEDYADLNEFYNLMIEWAEKEFQKNNLNEAELCELNVLSSEQYFLTSKKGVQYFIQDNKIIDFFEHSFKDNISLELILDNLPKDREGVSQLILNFPLNSGVKSIFACLAKGTMLGKALVIRVDGSSVTLKMDSFDAVLNHPVLSKYLRILLGFCLYIQCFPYAIRDGVPENCQHPNYYNFSERKTINTAKEILDDNDRTVTPHIRSGHFKLLGSEYYKKMKGQVIFVHECFVKGKAKTVENINKRKQIQEVIA